jgi:hypothetical protein
VTRTESPNTAGRYSVLLLVVQFICIWSTFFILSSAINWPISLGDPAEIALPRVLDNIGSVITGYSLYLLGALLLIPATAAVNQALGINRGLAQVTLGIAIVSAIAKMIGITRWLLAMPTLAQAWAMPGADQPTLSVIFNVLNDYAGGIGEIMGVGLMTGIWTVIMGAVVFRNGGKLSTLLGGFIIVTGLGLFAVFAESFGIDLGPVLTITNIAWQFGMLALAYAAYNNAKRA